MGKGSAGCGLRFATATALSVTSYYEQLHGDDLILGYFPVMAIFSEKSGGWWPGLIDLFFVSTKGRLLWMNGHAQIEMHFHERLGGWFLFINYYTVRLVVSVQDFFFFSFFVRHIPLLTPNMYQGCASMRDATGIYNWVADGTESLYWDKGE